MATTTPSSLFGAAHGAKQSLLEILRSTKRLPVASGDVGAVAWGHGPPVTWSPAAATAEPTAVTASMRRELRTLAAASFDVFMRLQRTATERRRAGRELATEELVRASREYREALVTAIFAIEDRRGQDAADGDQDLDDDQDELVDLLKVSLAIWHLCELLFLQRRPRDDKWLAYDLAAWLQEHYAGARLEELEATARRLHESVTKGQGTGPAEADPVFWPTVYALVMLGCGPQAWRLLTLHSSFRALFARDSASGTSTTESFQAIQRLLLCMPSNGKTTTRQQPIEWQNWRDACQYLLNSDGYIRGQRELRTLLEIMTADPQALNATATTWYELMMARLVLEEPKAVANRFEFLMANCFKVFHPDDTRATMNNFDCIILAILEYDVRSAVQDIHGLGLHWMSAHLTDLLSKSQVIAGDEPVEPFACSLQEFFILHYAVEIGSCIGMWQFAVGYFEKCRTYGIHALRSALANEAVDTDAKADRLLSYCQGKKGLLHSQRQISLRRAAECKQRHSYGAALHWSLRGKHFDECDNVCDLVLDECDNREDLTPLNEAVEFLEAHPDLAATKLLSWLITYRELQLVLDDRTSLAAQVGDDTNEQIHEQVKFVSTEAAKRLSKLVSSSMAPRRLRGALLQHIVTLLGDTPTVFTSQQLFAVEEFIRGIERAFDRSQFFRDPLNKKLVLRAQSLLPRNQAEAVLARGSRGSTAVSDNSRSFAALTSHFQLLPPSSKEFVQEAHDVAMED